ncbi:MAG: hypothetical protein HZA94_01585 [Candidatus Vogelbacteria bacterium]|nr:hypothetical protein [Candidatus Vogelbacteria bacterium]
MGEEMTTLTGFFVWALLRGALSLITDLFYGILVIISNPFVVFAVTLFIVNKYLKKRIRRFRIKTKLKRELKEAFHGDLTLQSITSDTNCRVCGDQLGNEQQVVCKLCETPHHLECWKFNSGCAIYGCGSYHHSAE